MPPTKYRNTRRGFRIRQPDLDFLNPYPWMPKTEAFIHFELERRGIPFSHRYFKEEWCPELIEVFRHTQRYAPEFTIPEKKTVIIVIGEFFGTIPGMIDRQALAKVILENEGWKFITWYERDILQSLPALFTRDLPNLGVRPGGPKVIINPAGPPDYLAKLRKALAQGRVLIRADRGTRYGVSKRRRRYSSRRSRIRRSNRF